MVREVRFAWDDSRELPQELTRSPWDDDSDLIPDKPPRRKSRRLSPPSPGPSTNPNRPPDDEPRSSL